MSSIDARNQAQIGLPIVVWFGVHFDMAWREKLATCCKVALDSSVAAAQRNRPQLLPPSCFLAATEIYLFFPTSDISLSTAVLGRCERHV